MLDSLLPCPFCHQSRSCIFPRQAFRFKVCHSLLLISCLPGLDALTLLHVCIRHASLLLLTLQASWHSSVRTPPHHNHPHLCFNHSRLSLNHPHLSLTHISPSPAPIPSLAHPPRRIHSHGPIFGSYPLLLVDSIVLFCRKGCWHNLSRVSFARRHPI